MQITIVQAEIEQAIRDYVSSQLKVADGMEMTIDLSATRGAEGFKATIDIHPITGVVKVAVTNQPTQAAQMTKPTIFTPPTISIRTTEPETKAVEETPSIIEGVNPETFAEDTTVNAAPDGEDKAEESKTEAPAQSSGNSRSLFKGLQKPKNN